MGVYDTIRGFVYAGRTTWARRRHPLPRRLVDLIRAGRWRHPGDNVLRTAVPFLSEPLLVLRDRAEMLRNSRPLMAADTAENKLFGEYRGSVLSARPLPWLDIDRAIFIFCNATPGDDVGIALDYRPGPDRPCVVASDSSDEPRGGGYRSVADSFDAFAEMIGLFDV